MVVERADSIIRTVARTKDPRRVFTGERTWSALEPRVSVELTLDKVPLRVAGFSKVVRRDPVWPDAIHYYDIAVYGPGNSEAKEHRVVIGDKINNPEEPWNRIVRYTKPQSADE